MSNEEFVRIAYRTLLDRDADAQGFEHWTGKLNDGNSWEFVIEGFIGSQEFSKLCDRYGITPGESKKVNDVTEAKTIVIDARTSGEADEGQRSRRPRLQPDEG